MAAGGRGDRPRNARSARGAAALWCDAAARAMLVHLARKHPAPCERFTGV